jgi:hypothetical protein
MAAHERPIYLGVILCERAKRDDLMAAFLQLPDERRRKFVGLIASHCNLHGESPGCL